MGRRRKKKERDRRVEMKERNLENIETILLWSITVVLPRIACFYSNPEKNLSIEPDRSIDRRRFVKPFKKAKENITSTTMYTDIKRKRNYQYITTLFYKRKTRKKNRIETVFTSFPIYPHSSMILFFQLVITI